MQQEKPALADEGLIFIRLSKGRYYLGCWAGLAVGQSLERLRVLQNEAVFLFFYFLFSFFTKIYFHFRNLQEYTPAAPLPSRRDLVAPLRGGRGFCAKNFAKIFARRSLGPVARQRGWRPPGRPAAGRPAPGLRRRIG